MKVNLMHIILISLIIPVFNYYFGSIGIFPIDSFAFFDSAHLIAKGLRPFEDYWVSNGLAVDYLQSIFFKFFGTNWFSYLLHASFVNILFITSTYIFFIKIGLDKNFSFFYSILTSILSYPVVGVPFPDHHSIFFSIIGFYFFYLLSTSNKLIYWCFLPIPFFISFLSKQVPSAYFMVVFFVVGLFYFTKKNNLKKFLYFFFGSLFLIILFVLFFVEKKISLINFIYQYLFFPLTIGDDRINNLKLSLIILKLINDFKFITLSFFILFYFFYKNIFVLKKKLPLKKNHYIIIFVLIFLTIFNQILTKNQNFIFFLIPILLGISHSQLSSALNVKNKNILVLLLILLSLFSTFKYHLRFNVDRKFMELQKIEKNNYIDASLISSKLKGLKWINSSYPNNPLDEVNLIIDSIKYLKKNNQKIIILSEYQFILSVIDYDIYSPNRWYTNDGVSYPLNNNKFYSYYKNFFIKQLLKNHIDYIYSFYPIDFESFDFIFINKCISSKKINSILTQHNIKKCLK